MIRHKVRNARFREFGATICLIGLAAFVLLGMGPAISSAQEEVADSDPPQNGASPETRSGLRTQTGDSGRLPDVIVPFGTGGETLHIVVVEKETQQLFLYSNDGKAIRLVYRMDCSTGKAKGRKLREGDLKTPEGVYFFTRAIEDKRLAPIYGSGAFTTDYPDLMDQIAGRTGSQIWLHGTDRPLKARDSSGCVALENANLDEIGKHITLNRTPVIITDKLSFGPPDANVRAKDAILKMLSEWQAAIDKGAYHDYLRFYDAEYLPDISWWTEWNRTRKRIRKENKALSFETKRAVMAKYEDIYVALAEQSVKFSGRDVSAGIRKLFLKKNGDAFKIVGEEYQGLPEELKRHERGNPFITAYRNLKIEPEKPAIQVAKTESEKEKEPEPVQTPVEPEEKEAVERMLENWLAAWSSKDIGKYGSHYAKGFRARGMNRNAWLRYKKQLNRQYRYIRVSKKGEPTIRRNGERILVSFEQRYESNAFKSKAIKHLTLKHEDGAWKIFRETSRRI